MTALASQIPAYEKLLEKGLITREQFETARQKQWREGGEIEEHLVALGYLAEEQMLAFLCKEYHYRYLALEGVEVDREAIHHIPAAIAHTYCLLPIRRAGNALAVAFADPLSREAMMALNRVTDFEIIPFAADREAIERALYLHYGHPPAAEKSDSICDEPPRFLLRRRHELGDDRYLQIGRGMALDKQKTFGSFVRDGPNEFALSVARMIAEGKAEESANPFLCFGEAGSGKTHLLMAIANFATAHTPEQRLIYTTGRRFSTEYLEALKENRVNPFRYFYREVDLLFVDNLDELVDRPWAQDELCETYCALTKNRKCLLMACRMDPRKVSRLLPKLKAAIEGGIIAGIGPYSLEAKIEILARRKGGIPIPSEVFPYLINRTEGTLEDLLDILEQVVAISITGKKEISRALVDSVLKIMGFAESPEWESFAKALSVGAVESGVSLRRPCE